MAADSYFAKDYAEARAKFLAAAKEAKAKPVNYPHPLQGPKGEKLATDVIRIGPPTATRLLILNSGTHGVEGFCGSGCFVGWLKSKEWKKLPKGVAVLMIHAINPYGFAWLRRVTEDNVDLNRNFVDHKSVPANAPYTKLHPVILPQQWTEASAVERRATFDAHRRAFGDKELQRAVGGGQYAHPDGVFYGGQKPTWSNKTFQAILAKHVKGVKHAAFIDFHTGLGPYGHGELIADALPATAEYAQLVHWFGEGVTSPEGGTSTSTTLTGVIRGAVDRAMPKAKVRGVTLEYGTFDKEVVLGALMADNWLHARGRLDGPEAKAIKAQIRKAFYPDERDWKELVFLRARQVIGHAMDALGEQKG